MKKSSSSTCGGSRTNRTEKDALVDVLTYLWSAHASRSPDHPDQRKSLGCANVGGKGCWFVTAFWSIHRYNHTDIYNIKNSKQHSNSDRVTTYLLTYFLTYSITFLLTYLLTQAGVSIFLTKCLCVLQTPDPDSRWDSDSNPNPLEWLWFHTQHHGDHQRFIIIIIITIIIITIIIIIIIMCFLFTTISPFASI